MKSSYSALLLTVLLAVSCNLTAQARPSSHFGTPSGFKSGFSSQKGNYTRSAPVPPPAPPAQKSGFGAFDKASAPPSAPPASGSALSRDMEQNAAQANALKTLDARRAAASSPPLRDPVTPAPQPGPAPVYNQPGYAQPMPQPIIVQQPSNGFMHGVIGFMLGRAMSQPHPVYYPGNNGAYNNGGNNGASDGGQVALSGSTGATSADMAPLPVEKPSFAAGVLRLFVWLALVSGLVWLVIYTLRKLRRLREANAARYSFERN